MRNDIKAYILKKIFQTTSEDDIIYSVCQKTGLDWDDAQALVEQVRIEHLDEIDARQIPIKSILALGFYVAGIILVIGPLIYLWALLDVTKTFLLFASDLSHANAETAIKVFQSRCALLSWFELPSIFFTIAVGVGIINANLRYMRNLWQTLFRQWSLID